MISEKAGGLVVLVCLGFELFDFDFTKNGPYGKGHGMSRKNPQKKKTVRIDIKKHQAIGRMCSS